jgi:hypothetical protein
MAATKTAKQIVRTGKYNYWDGGTVESCQTGILDGTMVPYAQKSGSHYNAEIVRLSDRGHDMMWYCTHGHPSRRTATECAEAQAQALAALA